MTTPDRLRKAVEEAGFVYHGRNVNGGYTRWGWPGDDSGIRDTFTIPADPDAPEFQELMAGVLEILQTSAQRGAQAAAVLAALRTPTAGDRVWLPTPSADKVKAAGGKTAVLGGNAGFILDLEKAVTSEACVVVSIDPNGLAVVENSYGQAAVHVSTLRLAVDGAACTP